MQSEGAVLETVEHNGIGSGGTHQFVEGLPPKSPRSAALGPPSTSGMRRSRISARSWSTAVAKGSSVNADAAM